MASLSRSVSSLAASARINVVLRIGSRVPRTACLNRVNGPTSVMGWRAGSSAAGSKRKQPITANDQAPTQIIGQGKVYKNAEDAVADIKSGSTILSSGFGLCGVAETIIQALAKRGNEVTNLTAVSNNAGAGDGGLASLVKSGQITKLIISYLGNNKVLEKKYLSGEIGIELCPQGTLAERIRAGGAGVPAFYTPTGVNTAVMTGGIPVRVGPPVEGSTETVVVEAGTPRETRVFDGKTYNMERAIKGDVGVLRAWKVDEAGNCRFRYTTKAFGVLVAKAAAISIVEAEEIVPVGSIHPDDVHLPGIYIDRIVPATAEKGIESRMTRSAEEKTTEAPKEKSPAMIRRERIAKRASKELKNGMYVNLGVGMPTLAPSFLNAETKVWIQSENGLLGLGPYPTEDEVDADLINAGKETVTMVPGGSTFDSAESFAMIRGGHVDVSILGALEVSANGDLANYMIPGKVVKGMGGAMDLVSNPEQTKIVCLTDHVDKYGKSKVVQECSLPLTGARVVSTIITDLCVFQVDLKDGGLTLTELAEGVTVEDIKAKTDASFKVAKDIQSME
ncbi:succinyl-CoA:3-ketoacid-coenzyme A transferas-like protein [Aureobasidium pullulans]|uniref:Succinyl-CoA:3-ketoacid-coenzyme A transferase n=1 Tax=Aureobasidium pullulans TaxID=5580 RepID=A0A4T0BPS2_AURPU|nr:succinyl-CoA:3-ketoacid-coenzyme A transferas-like protein [Aureobasidium pullulans]THX28243.1 succinyl-CoA:3-ketoacid-coenzyme A transferas-like protein [Aureobasidium pullulans]THY62898.1 succinyl-CoA:3-ketoacid-coenzyme A transferas-like protein [Aureobasidium pullulans]TIA34154.1 succinyl-CoA:3-ketoacid-coenzyme A transferas-like protein [Aureobasidium pullulans]